MLKFQRRYSSQALDLQGLKARVAVVGGGPSGFYVASRILSAPGSENIAVDIFEALPIPFGLSRYGVAPDHPEVKNCEHKFIETALDNRVRFLGNVQVGNSSLYPRANRVPLSTLHAHYHALVFSYGAPLDRGLGVPGEELTLSARDFVAWYNGHPYARIKDLDLTRVGNAAVIGQGNVALDVARLLLKSVDELREFDVPERVLAELVQSRVRHVDIVGRRGPLQLACTTKELRELVTLPGVGLVTDTAYVREALQAMPADMPGARGKKRALDLILKAKPAAAGSRTWSLSFLRSPVRFLGDNGVLSTTEYVENTLVGTQAQPTGVTHTVPTDAVFKSVGYQSYALDEGVPFDEGRHTVKNTEGRVCSEGPPFSDSLPTGPVSDHSSGAHPAPEDPLTYATGWVATGPTGVIATTMFNAFSTADSMASDLAKRAGTLPEKPELSLNAIGSAAPVVTWDAWEEIDRIELANGKSLNKIREKMTDIDEILAVAS